MRAFMDMCLCGSSASNAGKRGVAAKATAGPGGKTPQSAFRLPTGCTLVIRQGDLTQSDTDAIVNAGENTLVSWQLLHCNCGRVCGPCGVSQSARWRCTSRSGREVCMTYTVDAGSTFTHHTAPARVAVYHTPMAP